MAIRASSALALLALLACGAPEGPHGSVRLIVEAPGMSPATVTATLHSLSGGAASDLTRTLSISDSGYDTTIEDLPAGDYEFSARATDAAGAVLSQSPEPASWTLGILSAPVIALRLLPPGGQGTSGPVITDVISSGSGASGAVLVSARVVHPDGAAAGLSYRWSDGGAGGTFRDPAAYNTTWSPPPGYADDARLSFEASDWLGKKASLNLSLGKRKPTGSVLVVVALHRSPYVVSIGAADGQLAPSASTALTAAVAKSSAASLHYSWYARCGALAGDVPPDRDDLDDTAAGNARGGPNGWFEDRHSPTPAYTAPGSTGVCALTLIIREPGGPASMGVLYLRVSRPESVLQIAPVIDTATLTPFEAAPGAPVRLELRAHDPSQLPLRFLFCVWNPTALSCTSPLGDPMPGLRGGGAMGGSAQWIAPPCTGKEAGGTRTWNLAGIVESGVARVVHSFALLERCGP